MRLSHIELAGFRGFRQRLRLNVPSGFLVLSGRNGVGKSSIIDAIEFVLTGTIGKYRVETGGRETIEDYLWWRGSGMPDAHFVSLGLVDDAGNQTEVTRSKEKGLSISEAGLESLLCDEALKPWKPLEQICRTSIIRDELIASLTWEQGDIGRLEFVSSALGGVTSSNLGGIIEGAVKFAKNEQRHKQRDVDAAAARVRTLLADVSEAGDIARRASDLESAVARIETMIGQRQSVADLLIEARRNLAARRAAQGLWRNFLEDLRRFEAEREETHSDNFRGRFEQVRAIFEDKKGAREAILTRLRDAQQRLEVEEEGNALATSLASLAEHGERLGLHDGHCPLCQASRTQQEFRQNLERLKERVALMAGSLMQNRAWVAALTAEEAAARVELETAESEYRRMSEVGAALEATVTEIRNRWAQLSGEQLLPNVAGAELRISKDRQELSELERDVYVLEASLAVERLTRLEAAVATAQAESDKASADVAAISAAIRNLEEAGRSIIRVRGEVVDERLASLSPLLSELYYRLRPHRNWRSIDYMIRGDVRRFLSLRVGEGLNPQFLFSSGERRAAGLAFLLAIGLSRSWCRLETLFLDDPVQHVDDFRTLHLAEVLASIRKLRRQVIVAVEDSQLADLLCRRLRSTPDSPGARVELDYESEGTSLLTWSHVPPLPAAALLSA